MTSGMHQRGVKSFITHIMRFSGESRLDSQAGPKKSLERIRMGSCFRVLSWLGNRAGGIQHTGTDRG